MTFPHIKAPWIKVLSIQRHLKDNEIEFLGNDEWPGNSPDLSVCESVGATMKDRVEGLMLQESIHHCFSHAVLKKKVIAVLQNISDDTAHFESFYSPTQAEIKLFVRRLEETAKWILYV